MSTATNTDRKDGRVVAIAGPVIDVEFPRGSLPELNQALEFTVTVDGKPNVILAEVAQQLGQSRVRAVCMKPTDGLRRGTPVRDTGRGITVPVGDKTLGHVWNVWGDCLDGNNDDSKMSSSGRFTVRHRHSTRSNHRSVSLKRASKLLTCSPHIWLVEKSVCSVVQV